MGGTWRRSGSRAIALALAMAGCLEVPDATPPDAGPGDGDGDGGGDAGVVGEPAYRGLTSGEGDTICVIRVADGAVLCAGDNSHGQLGLSPIEAPSRIDPVVIPGGHVFTEVSAGLDHVCAIDDGRDLWCWGSDGRGQLGNGNPTGDVLTPQRVDLVGDVLAVGCGARFTCAAARDAGGSGVYCWGASDDSLGQLGESTTGDRVAPPANPLLAGVEVDQVVASSGHACARTDEDQLWCWGESTAGEIDGVSNTEGTVYGPTQLDLGASTALDLALSESATSYLEAGEDAVITQGIDADGQHGDGPATETPSPSYAILPGPAVELAAASLHHCARIADGRVYCWGNNASGQLTVGGPDDDGLTPLESMLPTGAVAIGVTRTASCAVGVDDSVTCWGAMPGVTATKSWTWIFPGD